MCRVRILGLVISDIVNNARPAPAPRAHRSTRSAPAPRALRAKRPWRTPRAPRYAFDEGRFARPPLRSRSANIKRLGAEQSGPDPIQPAASTGVLGYSYPDLFSPKEYGCSRLFISDIPKARAFSAFDSVYGRLGRSQPPLPSRARVISALPSLNIKLGRSRLCLRSTQGSGVLGLYPNTELGRSRLCLRYSPQRVHARFESRASRYAPE